MAAEVIERSAEPAAAGCGEVRVKMQKARAVMRLSKQQFGRAGNDERRQKSGPGR